jgi:D-arginine dehydrogenase
VGQGGYGIQSAPALSSTAAAIVQGKAFDTRLQDFGLNLADIASGRFAA